MVLASEPSKDSMSRILFVVQRYYPYPGGSENFVRWMAEEALRQGHEVTALAKDHRGDQNGVRLTADPYVLLSDWDLIVVHGPKEWPQQVAMLNAKKIKSPIYLMLVEPKDSAPMLAGLADVKYLGWSTSFDLAYIQKHNQSAKARQYHHAISPDSVGNTGFRKRYGITTSKMYLSVGGYWTHKRMKELVTGFNNAKVPDTTLVLMGYDNRENHLPKESQYVRTLLGSPQEDVYSAMREADLYIMHSSYEGFGLALLEAMANRTPWIANDIAAASDLREFGTTYNTDDELCALLQNPPNKNTEKVLAGLVLTLRHHSIQNCVSEILSVLQEPSPLDD